MYSFCAAAKESFSVQMINVFVQFLFLLLCLFVCLFFLIFLFSIFFRLVHKLPAGKAFVCMDLKEIPQILQQIFTSTFLSSSWGNEGQRSSNFFTKGQKSCDFVTAETNIFISGNSRWSLCLCGPQGNSTDLTTDIYINFSDVFMRQGRSEVIQLYIKGQRSCDFVPAGKAFVCMDLKKIPQILQQIFTSTFLSSSWGVKVRGHPTLHQGSEVMWLCNSR